MKRLEFGIGTKRVLSGCVAAAALTGCASEKTEAVPGPGISDVDISSVREAPAASVETPYTRGMRCSLEAAQIAVRQVLGERDDVELGASYFGDPTNQQSPHVMAEQIAPGTTKLQLDVTLQSNGELSLRPSDYVGYMIRGEMTFMQTVDEPWNSTLETARPDQIGLPGSGVAVWSPSDGGTINQPDKLCAVADELKSAIE